MKTKTAILAAFLLSGSLASAQTTVNLAWDPSPAAEEVFEYRLYQKVVTPAPGPIGGVIPPPAISWKLVGTATQPQIAVPNVPAGVTSFAVSAVNSVREGARSEEVSVTVLAAPSAPKGLKIVTIAVTP